MENENEQKKPEQPHVRLIMSPKAIIVKANKLVEARQRLSIQEQRIILLLISKIRPEDVNFLWYKFGILDFAKFLGIEKGQGIYLDVRKAVRKLMKRIITVDHKDRNIDLHWIEAAAYGEKGFIKICMNQVLKPYLLNLKAQFTKYNIGYIVHLRSTYSIRIYELLKRFEYLGEVTFNLDKLKFTLGVNEDEYKLYNHFKEKAILVAQKELFEKTDLAFIFEEIKSGKKVSEIRFIIKKNDPEQKFLALPEPPAFVCEEPIKPQRNQAQSESQSEPRPESAKPLKTFEESGDTEENFFRLVALLPTQFQKLKSVQDIIQRYLREYDFDFVARNIKYTNAKSNAVKPGTNSTRQANYYAYLSKTLAGDFGLPFQENEEVNAAAKAFVEQRRLAEEEAKRKEAERQAREDEDRIKAEAILQTLSESELEALRKQAIENLPPEIKTSRYASMMIKMAMQKLVMEKTITKTQR
ncbi:MAG: replication initiation protein [Terrimicrobiaceae bacterium]